MKLDRRSFLKGLLATVGAAAAAPLLPQVPPPPKIWQLDQTMLQPPVASTNVDEMIHAAVHHYNQDLMGLVNRHLNLGDGAVVIDGVQVATLRTWDMHSAYDLLQVGGFGERLVRPRHELRGRLGFGDATNPELGRAFAELKEVRVDLNGASYFGHITQLEWGTDGGMALDMELRRRVEHVNGRTAYVAHGDGLHRRADGTAIHLPKG